MLCLYCRVMRFYMLIQIEGDNTLHVRALLQFSKGDFANFYLKWFWFSYKWAAAFAAQQALLTSWFLLINRVSQILIMSLRLKIKTVKHFVVCMVLCGHCFSAMPCPASQHYYVHSMLSKIINWLGILVTFFKAFVVQELWDGYTVAFNVCVCFIFDTRFIDVVNKVTKMFHVCFYKLILWCDV